MNDHIVSGGFASVQPNSVLSINAPEAYPLEDFSADAIRAGIAEAQKVANGNGSEQDIAEAKIELEVREDTTWLYSCQTSANMLSIGSRDPFCPCQINDCRNINSCTTFLPVFSAEPKQLIPSCGAVTLKKGACLLLLADSWKICVAVCRRGS